MRLISRIKPIPFLILVSTSSVFADVNVCQNKYWLQNPIVKKKSDNESGIGGTGESLPNPQDKVAVLRSSEQDSGIGGSGLAPDIHRNVIALKTGDDESGIGGTGIIGVISGFGSICVNGIEVHYQPTTPIVEDQGLSLSSEQLALGQTVSILAYSASQQYIAKEIRVLHEVQGVVEWVNSTDGLFGVLGQTVHLPPALLEGFATGDTVMVSGNRLVDGSIQALRVENRAPLEHVSLMGPVELDQSSHDFRIGKQRIELSQRTMALKIGDEVSVNGVLKDGVLHVETLEVNPRLTFASRVDQLILQGYVRQSSDNQLNVDGIQIQVNEADLDKMKTRPVGERVGVLVRSTDKGQMVFDHWQSVNKLPEQSFNPQGNTQPKTAPLSSTNHEEQETTTLLRSKPLRSTADESSVPSADANHSDMTKSSALPPVVNRLNVDHSEVSHMDLNHPEIEKPSALRPDVERLEMQKSLLSRPTFNRLELTKPNVSRPELNRLELTKPEVSRPELNRLELTKPEVSRPELNRLELTRPEVSRPELNRLELTKPETSRPELNRLELTKPEMSRPELNRLELTKPETLRPELNEPISPR
jgi:hypothetical protein